jgi:uncharacterized membrane protein YfcA
MKVFLLYLALGGAVGCVSGMLGIGGGVLLMPALVWLFDFDQRVAAGITLAILAVPVTLPGVWQYYSQDVLGRRELEVAGCVAVAFAVGTYGGAGLQAYVPLAALRWGFGLLMIYVALRFILASNSEVARTAAGLTAAALAWLTYLGLRALGRRHLPPPGLGAHIRATPEQGYGETDYHI